ncbi:replication initiator protein [Microviridae sp.]|nr:replication initiator protein [Microviridae sp.]
MSCMKPLAMSKEVQLKTGKRKFISLAALKNENEHDSFVMDNRYYTIPCRQCLGCRMDYAKQWAIRCMHEASLHENNVFLTLTYDQNNIPNFGNLIYRDFQLFIKRLRKKYPREKGDEISYFVAGEYGEKTLRPHYHAIIFNFDFSDKKFLKKSFSKENYYTSEICSNLWNNQGHIIIGSVTFQSAGYVARYISKKQGMNQDHSFYDQKPDDFVNVSNQYVQRKFTSENTEREYYKYYKKNEVYQRMDAKTGEIYYVEPEFARMSLKPAIGKRWLDKYDTDIYNQDQLIFDKKRVKIPKYYDNLYSKKNEEHFLEIKQNRINNMENNNNLQKENTYARLKVRLNNLQDKCTKLIRSKV